MAQPPTAADAPPVDRLTWLACAFPLSRLPAVGSQVYYFPHGHSEQCPAPLPAPLPYPYIFPCTVAAVDIFADAKTDEPYATISLLPGPHRGPPLAEPEPNNFNSNPGEGEHAFSFFAKQLTQSDANNGGGFSVPRFCADFIFPKLNFDADSPVQKLLMRDLRGKPWEFRHVYRGTPRRHLLTTGWTKFVNAKLLVAGDTIVFMRRPDGELLVGVRRVPRYPVSLHAAGPLRNARARVPPQEVLDAAWFAAEGRPFTVTYYPRQGAGEFVVPRKEVEDAVSGNWEPGMQVRMKVMVAEDSRRFDWANGTVKAVNPSIIWRMLEVDWDESTSSFSTKIGYVNAWQVQLAGYPPLLKRFRISEAIPPPCSGNGATADPLMGPESHNMAILLGTPIPAGMQGARHNSPADVPSSSATMFATQVLLPGDLQVPPSLSGGSSEVVNPENESPPNNSMNMRPSDLPVEMRSIQLFGTTITLPMQSATNAAACEQVNQVPDGVVDGTAREDASATSPLDWRLNKDDGQNENDSRQGA